jgi:hypothetical protein
MSLSFMSCHSLSKASLEAALWLCSSESSATGAANSKAGIGRWEALPKRAWPLLPAQCAGRRTTVSLQR